MKKKIYKSEIKIIVLTEEPMPDGTSLRDICYNIDEGPWIGSPSLVSANIELTGKEAALAVIDSASDPEFFGMDEDGNEVEL